MVYPRSKNGWIDNGTPLQGVKKRPCPNCGSNCFLETISMEKCDTCGIECDYWNGGPNIIYQNMIDRLEHEREKEQEIAKIEEERITYEYNNRYDDDY